ncbi:13292_t:CDS:1, partial [Cetraspora pellucida]
QYWCHEGPYGLDKELMNESGNFFESRIEARAYDKVTGRYRYGSWLFIQTSQSIG